MLCKVVPEEACSRIVHVRDSLLEREFIGHAAARIVSTFLAAITDRPGFLVVVDVVEAVDQRCPSPETSPLS